MAKKRILFIDDESGFTRLLKLALPTYEICEVNDSTKGLATAHSFRPDLIFIDVIMPDLDGGSLAADIRADPALSRIPIVFLTAIRTPDDQSTIGGFPFLSKPVAKDTIIECIDQHLGI